MRILKRVIRIICYVIIIGCTGGLILSCFHSDYLDVTTYTYDSGKSLETEYKIVVVADFHHRDIYFPNGNLVDKINEQNPNVVFFAGDMVDEYTTTIDPVLKIIDGTKAPIYYVTGNHDYKSPFFEKFLEEANKRENFNYIDKQYLQLNDRINLFGLHDPVMDSHSYNPFSKDYGKLKEQLDKWTSDGLFDKNKVNILLTHRPELTDLYVKYDVDMVICGHSHGGQIRIGNFSPFRISHGFSKYDRGEFIENNKHIFVSAGLGYSAMIPIRINCNPEILSITIK